MSFDLVRKTLDAFGVGIPFLYAALTYWLFHWLDKRASGPAKRALSDWVKSSRYNHKQVASAMVESFDTIYTYPLLRPRAMIRVAMISFVLHCIIMYTSFSSFMFVVMWN